MAGFNPDQFLTETAPQATGFNPDKFLAETAQAPAKPMGYGEQLGRATLDAIPAAGAMVGGIIATPETGGLGTVPGAALGYGAGKQLSRMLKNKIYGDDIGSTDPVGMAKQSVGDLKEGAMLEMGGQSIAALPGLAKSGYGAASDFIKNKIGPSLDYTPIANKEAVQSAAQNLGLNLPKAVLTDNPTYQKLESGLSQSGSLPAKEVRDQYSILNKGLDAASQKIADLKTPDSDFVIGQGIKSDLTNQVKSAKAPVTDMYNAIAPDLKNIPVDEGVTNKVFGNLKKNPIFQTTDGKEFLEEHRDMVSNQPDLASLKELRTTVGQSVAHGDADITKLRADQMQRALTSIRDNSVEALKSNLPTEAHGEIDNLQNQIALADSAHASNVKDLNSIKAMVGNKPISSPGSFLSKVGDAKEADFAQRAANLDVQSMQNLKDKFPSVFEKAKTAKINDMISSATNPSSGFNESRFFKQYDNLDNETKNLIFSPEMRSHIEDLKTVKQAIPDKLGPSGTPEGHMMMDMFSPKRNALDLGIKSALNNAGKASDLALPPITPSAAASDNVRPLLQLLKSSTTPSASAPSRFPKAADKGESVSKAQPAPIKGPDKWASDGHANLIAHAVDSDVKDQLNDSKEALMADPKSKDLLVAASDVKPRSNAMEKILNEVKKKIGKGAN